MSCIVVFGRQPRPGVVKTRLAESIGGVAAAAVYGELLDHTLRTARASGTEVVLSLAQKASHDWVHPAGIRVETQPEGDLGARMRDAFGRRFSEGHRRVVVVGSDCAPLRVHHLLEALEDLDRHRVVLGPARDGGYWLVGQVGPGLDLFSSIPWSSATTLTATRDRLRHLDMEWSELETLDDLDTERDLRRAVKSTSVDLHVAERLRIAWHGTRENRP